MEKKALLGAITADAASMPLQWIYDQDELKKKILNSSKPEFNLEVACPLFDSVAYPGRYEVGQLSPFGEQLLALTQIIRSSKETDNIDVIASKFADWIVKDAGRKDHTCLKFQAGIIDGKSYPECGLTDDSNSHCLTKAVVAVGTGRYTNVLKLIRFQQNCDLALECGDFMASLLMKIVAGKSPVEAFNEVKKLAPLNLSEHLEYIERNLYRNTLQFLISWKMKFKIEGNNHITSANPGTLVRIIHILLTARSFQEGIRLNILVGGDICSAAIPLGACLGMHFGIPLSWLIQMDLQLLPTLGDEDLTLLVKLRRGLESEIKDRKWRMKKYRSCFEHKHAIFCMKNEEDPFKEDLCVAKLNSLVHAGYISHVTEDHTFKVGENRTLYFRFTDVI